MKLDPEPNKILAIKFRTLGDTVLMSASLQAIHEKFPQSEIHVAVLKEWAPLFEQLSYVKKVWTFSSHTSRAVKLARVLKLSNLLRKEKFSAAVCFHASSTSALLAYLSGIKKRSIHFHGHGDKNRFSTVLVPGKGSVKPIIERDLDAVRALGVEIRSGILPKIYLSEREKNEALHFFQELKIQSPLLGLGLGSSRPTKTWPIERFALLSVLWCQKTKGSVLVFLSDDEKKLAHSFLKTLDEMLSRHVTVLPERAWIRSQIKCQLGLPLRTLSAQLEKCSVFLGNDSGPKHLAVAVGTPTVTLFGPEHPLEWHPYDRDNHPYFFIDGLSCRLQTHPGAPPWCGIHVCTEHNHECMKKIGVEEVFQECQRVLLKRELHSLLKREILCPL